ncbi:hypothetical protein LWI29_033965 [Acer saccharum]|uniref:Uncharacterized protein n=1 Tax=Acer saccharum TaxID=4024 RepID=A0AA39V424_ACESA|nr:hypothetical protein LWI29_033965 [Acer saccharum]
MRMEAAQAEVGSNAEALSGPSSLSNPLLENPATQPVQESYATPRFDFYTDPMSAFSTNKKRGQHDNQIAQDYPTHLKDSASSTARPLSSLPVPHLIIECIKHKVHTTVLLHMEAQEVW